MTIADIAIIGLLLGIAVCGLFFAWLLRREPRKVLNIAVLTLGMALLTAVHLRWASRHESPEVKEAMFIRYVVAGWALVGMGFVGLQCGHDSTKGNSPD